MKKWQAIQARLLAEVFYTSQANVTFSIPSTHKWKKNKKRTFIIHFTICYFALIISYIPLFTASNKDYECFVFCLPKGIQEKKKNREILRIFHIINHRIGVKAT